MHSVKSANTAAYLDKPTNQKVVKCLHLADVRHSGSNKTQRNYILDFNPQSVDKHRAVYCSVVGRCSKSFVVKIQIKEKGEWLLLQLYIWRNALAFGR